jgi:hypothetical protein
MLLLHLQHMHAAIARSAVMRRTGAGFFRHSSLVRIASTQARE